MQRMVIDQLTEPDAAWGAPAAVSGSTVEDRATLVDDMRYRNLMKFGRIVPDICSAGKSRFLGFRFFAGFSKQLKISISPKFRFVAFLNFHIFFSQKTVSLSCSSS